MSLPAMIETVRILTLEFKEFKYGFDPLEEQEVRDGINGREMNGRKK